MEVKPQSPPKSLSNAITAALTRVGMTVVTSEKWLVALMMSNRAVLNSVYTEKAVARQFKHISEDVLTHRCARTTMIAISSNHKV